MIELVFVIVVIAILAAAIIPRMERNTLFEASEQLRSHIQYTQHLAMVDNVYNDTNSTWYESMWQISFRTCTGDSNLGYYIIFRDENHAGGANKDESAKDPLTGLYLYSDNACVTDPDNLNDVILRDKYNIDDIVLDGDCFSGNQYIAFDQLGRPHVDVSTPYNVSHESCSITLVNGDDNATITIMPETGFMRTTMTIDGITTIL
jgi:type II secretory pathway pseudopilin PulG